MPETFRPTAEDMQAETQPYPGRQSAMRMQPASDLSGYRPAGKLLGKTALMTGGDSGIGRAVAAAFAMEGVRVAILYNANDGDPEPDVEEGLADLRVIEGIVRALETGERQVLEPFQRSRRIAPQAQRSTLSKVTPPADIGASTPSRTAD